MKKVPGDRKGSGTCSSAAVAEYLNLIGFPLSHKNLQLYAELSLRWCFKDIKFERKVVSLPFSLKGIPCSCIKISFVSVASGHLNLCLYSSVTNIIVSSKWVYHVS